MIINGTVTDINGRPLQSIFVCIDTMYLDLDINETMSYEDGTFTDEEGKFIKMYKAGYPTAFMADWPSELVMVAIDSSGVYESQKRSFPVERTPRFTEKDASVTADFVMKKK